MSEVFAALRNALDEHRDEYELWMPEIPQGAAPQDIPDGLPPVLARLLAASDGPNLGTSTRLFSAEEIASQQVPDHLVGAKLNDGSELTDASHFIFFGEAAENPLLLNERDGTVWRVPDDGVVWYTGCRLEQIANSFNEFVAEWVLDADRFLDLAGLTPSEAMDSDWYRLLKLSGLES
ncbi:hypothetical protein GCM10009759_03590 [Kitasatospora saccharophila]|uniref:SUKH superfamily protein n=1 Tax=Kitasatospora saccharophila TaxID=407973 RepID=A0ABN2W781_9ACTN